MVTWHSKSDEGYNSYTYRKGANRGLRGLGFWGCGFRVWSAGLRYLVLGSYRICVSISETVAE